MENIAYDIAFNIGWSLFSSLISKVNAEIQKVDFPDEVKKVSKEVFNEYIGSELDTDEFRNYIESYSFRKVIQTHYLYLYYNQEGELPEEALEEILIDKFPQVNKALIKDFLQNIRIYYEKLLSGIAADSQDSSVIAGFQLSVAMNKSVISEIRQNRQALKEIYSKIENLAVEISDEDVEHYHENCHSLYGKIKFTGIVGAERSPEQDINKYYIENHFLKLNNHKEEFGKKSKADFQDYCGLESFFDTSNKIVIIGKAGYGKSTTINYLYCNFEKLYNEKVFKIKIDLKDYAKSISENREDLLTCLAKEVSLKIKNYKSDIDALKIKIGSYLDSGKCLIVFDALDEITTQKAREDVRESISSLCNLYPLSKYIVTSREVGYLSNDFDDDFLHYRICEFSDNQIEKYINNWLDINRQSSREEFITNFNLAVDNANCRDLITSPIILVLALIIFHIDKQLPKDRISFYEKCINTFLFQREDSKGTIDDSFKNFVTDENILPSVANYKFEHILKDMEYSFNKGELRSAILKGADIDKFKAFFVNDALNEYIKYLVNRTELVIEENDDVYGFSHKTFYDYFVAKYYSTHYDFEVLKTFLIEWIGDSNYDELSRLIIENLKSNYPPKYKQVMDYLFEYVGDINYNNIKIDNQKLSKCYAIFDLFEYLNFAEMMTPNCKVDFNLLLMKNTRLQSRPSIGLTINESDMVPYFASLYKNENLLEIIDSLCYLSPKFSSYVVKKFNDDKLLVKLHELVKYCQRNKVLQSIDTDFDTESSDNKRDEVNKEQLIKYFLSEQIELTQRSPFLYLTILSVLLQTNKSFVDIMPRMNFLSSISLYRYTVPELMFSLIEKSYNDDRVREYLLELLNRTINDNYDVFFITMKRHKRFSLKEKLRITRQKVLEQKEYIEFKEYCDELYKELEEST